ncbi:MAG: fructose-bisphosphatase class III [Acutalibacteraceae bacterium]
MVYTEKKDVYYTLINDEITAEKIFAEFGVKGENRHIINGHVPIHHIEGETPVKCGGEVIIIDGGFARPYHKVTGLLLKCVKKEFLSATPITALK